MDLWLWDPPDDQGFSTSKHDNEDHSLGDFYCGYGRDVIEEDALNERSCLQVLNILVSKADEEITELNEDMLMLHCQLAWYNEDFIGKTDHLNILIQNLKNGTTKDVQNPDLQLEQPVDLQLEQLVDLQVEQPVDLQLEQQSQNLKNGTTEDVHNPDLQLEQQPQSLDGFPKPLLEHSVKIKQEKTEDIAPKENNNLEEKECVNKEKSEVVASKNNKNIEEKECCITMLETNRRKSQPVELEVGFMKQGSKSPRKVRKARGYEHANVVDKNVASVKRKRKRKRKRKTSEFPETGRRHPIISKEGEKEQIREIKVDLEHETLPTYPAKSLERELGSSSSTQNVNVQQTYGLVGINISKNAEKSVASASSSLPEKVTETIECSRKLPIKLEIKDNDTSLIRTADETREGVGQCTDDLMKLTIVDLKAICKKLEMKGYTKLRKAELIKLIEQKAPHSL